LTDKTHLEEFKGGVTAPLSKRLVDTFIQCHRDPSMKLADIITRLKEDMEGGLRKDNDAPS